MADSHDCDLLVLGSGAAGLAAALIGATRGARVTVLEKSETIGGTTALAGGVVWVPGNHHGVAKGIGDALETAKTLIMTTADGRAPEALVDRFLEAGPSVVQALETLAGFEFVLLEDYPDYQPELPGGRAGGRALDNPLFDTNELGEWQARLRRNPVNGKAPITITEAMAWQVFSNPMAYPFKEVYGRYKAGFVHGGAALIGRLLKSCLAAGVEVLTGVAAERLLVEDARVVGVTASDGSERRAARGVVLATGGFEWSAELSAGFLRGVPDRPNTPPSCTGDGLRMAMAVGAQLGNMAEAWWAPSVVVPDETYEGAPMYRAEFSARCLPHSLIVNREGQRFVNEAGNYNDTTRGLFAFDPTGYRYPNRDAWLIADGQFLEKYIFITAIPGRPVPDWIAQADSLADLAQQIGVDEAGLAATVERFNGFVSEGVDLDFGRGRSAFDRFYGDPNYTPNPNLGAIERSPFVAVQIHAGTLGTKGGPRTDVDARVLDTEGQVIPGLYAAGNAAASPMGGGYPGPGCTIASALIFGYLAATHACG